MRGTVMIVDDEPLIRKGLTKLIETNELGWTVAGEAGNGREAVERLEELEPDLILTDIRMPVMDGIELAKHVAESNLAMTVIMLTGYRDFEYAQAAVRYGVKEFLLKPCPEEEICRVLRESYSKFRERREMKEKECRVHQVQEDHALRASLLRLPPPSGGQSQPGEWLDGHGFWLVKVETFMPQAKEYRPEDEQLLQFAIGNIMEELMEERVRRGRWITVEYGLFALFLEPADNNPLFFEQLCMTVERLLGIPLAVLPLGSVSSALEAANLYEAYCSEAASQTENLEDTDADSGRMVETRVRTVQAEMTSFLLLGRHEELPVYLRQTVWEGRQQGTLAQCKTDALCLALAIREVMRKELAAGQGERDISTEISELRVMETQEQVNAWVQERISILEQSIAQWLEERNGRLAERTIRYIEQYYMQECSLAGVASHLHLNANYFSNLFKKQTGESFISYLMRFRMDKAKMLLTNTDMRISEIADAVGYADSNYFATAFRQAAGQSPSEYRKQHQPKLK
ncbi:response regulator transcription factor [Paenibacillus piri]|uniref:Response regulator n=1 Tax=Paenibacillus piri TaxID=2547395 RepID=A0A4R5KGE3_9BACL|nr:response regulator [Paenibacillus piri]TDF94376.1 response regulator [Paenibacillus piri]